MDCRDVALAYAECGKSVIPISRSSKLPLVSWKEYQTRVAGPAEINGWWNKFPEANVGLVTGKLSGVLVVDCDSPEATSRIQEILPDSIEIPLQSTPGGGRHFFFKHTPGFVNKARVTEGTDIRTEGGYVMIAPSADNRGEWAWVTDDILRIEPREMPASLVSFLQPPGSTGRSSSVILHTAEVDRGELDTIYKDLSIYRGNKIQVQSLKLGSRNSTVFKMLMEDRRRGLTDIQVLESAMIYAKACKPRLTENEAKKIYESAMKYPLEGASAIAVQDERNPYAVIPGASRVHPRCIPGASEVQIGIKSELLLWINEIGSCAFTLREAYEAVGAETASEKSQIRTRLSELCHEGMITRLAGKGSNFRSIRGAVNFTDYKHAVQPSQVEIWMPLGIHKKGKIFQGNHIVIAGPTGKGKTTFILSMIQEVQKKYNTYYYGSEMTAGEIREKLSYFTDPIDHWTMRMVAKKDWSYNDIADLIAFDRNGIHFIDYLSPDDEKFYNIGKKMEDCCNQLEKGVIVFSVQQNRPKESLYGVGGAFSAHGATMYISLNYDTIDLVKVRFAEEDKNRICTRKEFTLGPRNIYLDKTDWYDPSAAKRIKKDYFEADDD